VTYRQLATMSIKKHEGLRLKAYQDTVGVWTIGYGTNLQELEISPMLAEDLLQRGLDTAINDAETWAGEDTWDALSATRKAVLIDMAYNMGLPTLMQFKNTRRHLQAGEYDDVAEHMLDSKWARQVGQRAQTLAQQMREG